MVVKENNLTCSPNNTKISAIKAFTDNYIWAIENSTHVALVDPGDADVCIKYLQQHQKTLSALLITHHHSDHTGGIKKLVAYCQQKQWPLAVFGPAHEDVPCCEIKLIENDQVNLPNLEVTFRVIDLPGHTLGHIAYFAENKSNHEPILFCGDTLFSGGCGRIFEGTPEQMFSSLTKLAKLPEQTKVYCAHEYTQANLNFALTVEPNNQDLIRYNNQVKILRESNQSTIPTTISIEKQINPFLRSHQSTVQTSAINFDKNTQANTLDAFTTIRRWKDQF